MFRKQVMPHPAEKHPFAPFIPPNSRVLVTGSFPGREQTQHPVSDQDWYYGAPRNQFWKIIEIVFGETLSGRTEKENLFTLHGIAVADLFAEVRRSAESNGDEHLEIIEENTVISQILVDFPEIQVLCTSKFVEQMFRKMHPGHPYVVALPSPSPRNARLRTEEKAGIYARWFLS